MSLRPRRRPLGTAAASLDRRRLAPALILADGVLTAAVILTSAVRDSSPSLSPAPPNNGRLAPDPMDSFDEVSTLP